VELCPEERVTFTCTVPSVAHSWVIVNGSAELTVGSVSLGGDLIITNLGFVLAVVM